VTNSHPDIYLPRDFHANTGDYLMSATNYEPVRHRPHVFRAPDLWTVEGDHVVRTQPSGKRDLFALDSLCEIHLWRNTPTQHRWNKFDSFLWLSLCFGTTWQRLSGAYPRGIHGIENQNARIKQFILSLISRRQDDPKLRIHIGSRLEGAVGRIQIAIILVLPFALLFGATIWITGRENIGSALPLLGVVAVVSALTSAIVWLKMRREITKRINNGTLIFLTVKEFAAQPWEGLDG
jgi:hypothetical protein